MLTDFDISTLVLGVLPVVIEAVKYSYRYFVSRTPAARLRALDRTVAEIQEIIDENAEHGSLDPEHAAEWEELKDALRRLRIEVVQPNTSGTVPGISSRLAELAERMRRFKETCARAAAQYDAGGDHAAGHPTPDFSPTSSALFESSRAPNAAAAVGNAVALQPAGAPSDMPDVRPSPRLEAATVEHTQAPVDEALCSGKPEYSQNQAVPSASDTRSTLIPEADNKSSTDAVSNAAQSEIKEAAAVKRTSTHKAEHSVVAESDTGVPLSPRALPARPLSWPRFCPPMARTMPHLRQVPRRSTCA